MGWAPDRGERVSGRIPRQFIDDLLQRVDLVDLIDGYVPLKKSGSNYVARCPFHNEKTPSFSVNRDKQFFHCFGCGASGNAIGFLMDYNRLGFVEAVEDLAAHAGVAVPREVADAHLPAATQQDLQAVYQTLQQAADFFVEQLKISPEAKKAVDYLRQRGVSGEVARDFQLGYAPEDGRALARHFPARSLLNAGLLVEKEGGAGYARFRGRVMFPIRDRRGRVVGFGGRVLDASVPKYLNSPETETFHKGKEVYGLYELLRKQNKPQRILVVEGYMDVIALHQYGIHYAVATLGTATSRAHVELLFRLCPELVFCFDGDKAGQDAAWRAMDTALPSLKGGRQVRVMLLPEGSDPDSLVREIGVDAFLEKILSATTLSEYLFDGLGAKLDLNSIEGRAALAEHAKPYLDKLPAGVYRDMMFARLKELARNDALEVSGNSPKLYPAGRQRQRREARQAPSPMRTAIALLLLHPQLAVRAADKEGELAALDVPGIGLLMALLGHALENPKLNLAGLLERFRGLPEERQLQALARLEIQIPDVEREFDGALVRLLQQGREQQLDLLLAKEKEQGLDPQERARLLAMLMQKG